MTDLPLANYCAGSIRLEEAGAEIALRIDTVKAVDAWLRVRDKRSDKLLPPACARSSREAAIAPACDRFWTRLACRGDDEGRIEAEEALRGLWSMIGPNARALIFSRISNRGGWDPAFVESLALTPRGAAPPKIVLTRQQARTGQKEILDAWQRHPDKDSFPFWDGQGGTPF